MGGPGVGGGGGDSENIGGANFQIDVNSNAEETLNRINEAIEDTADALEEVGEASDSLDQIARRYIEAAQRGEILSDRITKQITLMRAFGAEASSIERAFTQRGEQVPGRAQAQIEEFREAEEVVRRFIGQIDKASEIPAKLAPGEQAVRKFNQTVIAATKDNEKFDQSTRLEQAGVPQLTTAEKQTQAYQATVERAAKANHAFDESARLERLGVPQVSAADKKVQAYQAQVARAAKENERLESITRNQKLGVPQINAADRALQQYAKTHERALRENQEINQGLRDTEGRLLKSAAGAGAAGQKLTPFAQKLQGVMNSATGALARFGLTSRDVGLILGTGLLSGGLALIAREALQMLQAIGKAALDLARMAAEVIHLREQVDATFGPASEDIRDFARTTTAAFGVSEGAALKFLNQTGLILQSMRVGKQTAAGLAEGLFQAAVVFQRVSGNGATVEQVLQDLQGTLTGNIEALRKYGVAVSEADLRQKAIELGLGRTTGELRSTEKGLLALIFTYDQALDRLDEFGKLSESQLTTEEKLAAASKDLSVKFGELLAPILLKLTEVGIDFVTFLSDGIEDLRDWIGESPELAAAIEAVADAFVGIQKLQLGTVFNLIKIALTPLKLEFKLLADVASRAAKAIDIIRGITPAEREAMDAAAARERQQRENAETEKKLREEREKAVKALIEERKNYVATTDDLEKLKDAHEKLNRAREDGARRVQEAEDEYQDTIRQNARAIEDANRRVVDAYKDRDRSVGDALRRIQEAEVQNKRSVEDAQRALEEAQIQASRSVRDAEERLSDARIQNARKVRDAEKQLFDARKRQLQQIFDARLSESQALAAGDSEALTTARIQLARVRQDTSIKDAQVKLNEDIGDSAKELARLERDLAEERIDAKKKVEQAERTLSRAVEDAAKRMADAERTLVRAVEDAEDKIEDALRDRRRTYEDAAERITEAEQRIEDAQREANEAIADAQEEVDELNFRFNTTSLTLGDIIEKLTVAKRLLEDINLLEQPGNTMNREDGTIDVFGGGGHFSAGRPRIVGDDGPELEIPHYPGAIVSNADVIRALREIMQSPERNGSGSGKIFENLNVTTNREDPAVVAWKTARELARYIG